MKLMNEICISIEYTSSKKKKNVVSNLEMGFSYLKTYFEYNFKNQNWFDHSENRIRKNIHNCFFHFSKWLFSQSSFAHYVR